MTKQGRPVWVLLAASLVRDDDGAPSHFISQIKDITETRELEKRLRQLADHDPVTDLLNRRRFEDELVRQVGRCRRYGETACLMILDVDDFKGVNDAVDRVSDSPSAEEQQLPDRRVQAGVQHGGDHASETTAQTAE